MTQARFDFSGYAVRLVGVEAAMLGRLESEWAPFVAPAADRPILELEIVSAADELDDSAPYEPKRMIGRFDGEIARFEMPEGSLEVDRGGHGRARLVKDVGGRSYYTLINFVRAGLAWVLPGHGGCLLHAAGIELDGRAFVLVAAEGGGKSTWSRIAEEAGATVISDDLVLVSGAGDRPSLLGAPFRSTHVTRPRKGSWPLAAVLFPSHGATASITRVPGVVATARIVANLPFVADAIEGDPRIAAVATGLVANTDCAGLTFAPDPGFMDLLRAWQLGETS